MILGLIPAQRVAAGFRFVVCRDSRGIDRAGARIQQSSRGFADILFLSVWARHCLRRLRRLRLAMIVMGPHASLPTLLWALGFLGSGAVIKQEDSVQGLDDGGEYLGGRGHRHCGSTESVFSRGGRRSIVLVTLFVLRHFESNDACGKGGNQSAWTKE